MTPIFDRIIEHPSAWTSKELGGKERLIRRLTNEQVDAIELLLRQTAHLKPQQVTRADFDHPVVNELLTAVRKEILDGRGAVIVSGIAPDRFSEEQFQRIFWGFGTHLGIAAEQSANGDRLGHVQAAEGDQHGRGYRSLQELNMHSDSYEVIGLMCVRKALSGGMTGIVSSLAIHNEILKLRPELLPALYRGYYFAAGEAKFSSKPITDDMVPVFCNVDGKVSCSFEPTHMRDAAVMRHEPLPGDLDEALQVFGAIAKRDDLALRFQIEPGEMMLLNNFTNLHSRTEFKEAPGAKRLLFRLWLTIPDGRPCDPGMRIRAQTYERVYRERVARESAPTQA